MVIPVLNAADHLGDQLGALASQRYPQRWEVIVVDNGSTDGSRKIAESFSSELELKVIEATARRGPAHPRNVGAAAAEGSKLLFVDADDEVAPGYIAAMSRALESAGLVAARLDHATLNPAWMRGAFGDTGQELGVDVAFDFLPAAASCSLGVRRTIFEDVGGFREDLRTAEDVAFCWDAQLAGTALEFVDEAIVRFRYRKSLGGLFRQTRTQGACLPLLYRLYRNEGMRRRVAIRAWGTVLLHLTRARTRSDLAKVIAQLGYRIGRLEGSLRHRVLYL